MPPLCTAGRQDLIIASPDCVIKTPIGKLGVITADSSLSGLFWLNQQTRLVPPKGRFAKDICNAVSRYFKYSNKFPEFPLKLLGTQFQKRVWREMQNIPVGAVVTYGQLAKKLKTGSRAIGMACRTNPVVILVPCHRVVSAQGIGGYMGKLKQLQVKEWLLVHEGVSCQKMTGN